MLTVEAGKRIALANVLFATDFSPCSNSAFPYALSIARQFEGKLHAAHVLPSTTELLLMSPETWPALSVRLAEDEEKMAEQYFKELEKQLHGFPYEILMPRGDVAAAIAHIIDERKIDLLVLGTHGRVGVSKLLLGSIAEEVIRRAACAVLSTGPNISKLAIGEIPFQHILFATDFSDNSRAALAHALSLAEEDQAQLTLLHIAEHPAAGIPDLEEVKALLRLRLEGMVPTEANDWCHTECLVEFGRQFEPPAAPILQVARERAADLIVLGVRPIRGRTGIVTHLASTQATCPVLTVRGGK